MTNPNEFKKAAASNRCKVEAELDKLAKLMQQDGESFEKAYSRGLDTDMGKALMQSRDDAQELERGGITSMDVAEAHKKMADWPSSIQTSPYLQGNWAHFGPDVPSATPMHCF